MVQFLVTRRTLHIAKHSLILLSIISCYVHQETNFKCKSLARYCIPLHYLRAIKLLIVFISFQSCRLVVGNIHYYNSVTLSVIPHQPPRLSQPKYGDRTIRGVDYSNRNGNLRLSLTRILTTASPRDSTNFTLGKLF